MKHRVLLVSDDATWRNGVRRCFEASGYLVTSAQDTADALRAIASRLPDIIVHELRTGEVTPELARHLRALPRGASVAVVGVCETPAPLPDEAGYCAVLHKSADPRVLDRMLRTLLATEDRDPVGRGRAIILADDSALQRKLVRSSLVEWGFRVEEASSAGDALRLARRSPPAAIVSDFLMPGADGLTFCAAAKREQRLARVPFIVVSSILFAEQRLDAAKEFGVDAFVSSKPRHRALARALCALLPQSP